MPITEDVIVRHPNGADDYHRFETLLTQFSDRAHVLDATGWFSGTGDFADVFHLNGMGRERFTRSIAEFFVRLGSGS